MEEINLKHALSKAEIESLTKSFKNAEKVPDARDLSFEVVPKGENLQVREYKGGSKALAGVLIFSAKNDNGEFTHLQTAMEKNDFIQLMYDAKANNPELFKKVNEAVQDSKLELNKSDELYLDAEYVRRHEGTIIAQAKSKLNSLNKEYMNGGNLFDDYGRTTDQKAVDQLLNNKSDPKLTAAVADALSDINQFSSVKMLTEMSKSVALGMPIKGIKKNEATVLETMVNKDFINAMNSDKQFAIEAMALMTNILKAGDQTKSPEHKEIAEGLQEKFKKKTGYSIEL